MIQLRFRALSTRISGRVLVLLMFMANGCTQRAGLRVDLLDQIPADESAGPWRVIALHRISAASISGASGFRIRGDALVQAADTSYIRLPASARVGERVMVRVSYNRRWENSTDDGRDQESVEARLLAGSETRARLKRHLKGWAIDFLLPEVKSPVEYVEISHILKQNSDVPLNSIAVLAISGHATQQQVDRTRRFLAWAARDHGGYVSFGLRYKKFPVAVDLCTRESVALTSGDTLTLALPPGGCERIRFSVGGLRVTPTEDCLLALEGECEGLWREIGSWGGEWIRPFSWNEITVPMANEHGWGRLRFSFSGRGHVIAIASPTALSARTGFPKQERMNLIVIDLDTMRADRLGCYGYTGRPTSQRLDSLLDAKGFMVFKRAYSAAPWTLPATAKFLTSRYVNIEQGTTIPRQYTTMAEILRSEDYYCQAFTGGGFLRCPGFEQGFHEFHWTDRYGKSEDVFPKAAEWLCRERIEPFFLFIHTYESHMPYTRDIFCAGLPPGRLGDLSRGESLFPSEWTENAESGSRETVTAAESLYIEAAYDGGVRRACDATVDFLTLLKNQHLWKRTVVVILSDHGEEFWDHSDVFADHPLHSLYDELLRVPFMIYSPDDRKEKMRISMVPVSTVDLVPTVANLLDTHSSGKYDGESLAPLLNGSVFERQVPVLATTWRDDQLSPSAWKTCVFSNEAKLIEHFDSDAAEGNGNRDSWHPGPGELYDLREDPDESRNILENSPQMTHAMRELLHSGLKASLQSEERATNEYEPQELPRDLKAQLEALGYIETR